MIELHRPVVAVNSLPRGLALYSLWTDDHPIPLGLCWITGHRLFEDAARTYADIIDIVVCDWARRSKVGTLLLDAVRKDYPTLRTDRGTADGLPFIQAYGFAADADLGWVFRPLEGKS